VVATKYICDSVYSLLQCLSFVRTRAKGSVEVLAFCENALERSSSGLDVHGCHTGRGMHANGPKFDF
jgi:hypothetical protein